MYTIAFSEQTPQMWQKTITHNNIFYDKVKKNTAYLEA